MQKYIGLLNIKPFTNFFFYSLLDDDGDILALNVQWQVFNAYRDVNISINI